jgi:hypothetical protein
LKKYADKAGVDFNKLKDPSSINGIFINNINIRVGQGFGNHDILNIKKGDSIELSYPTESNERNPIGDITAVGLTSEVPMGVSTYNSSLQPAIIVSEDTLNRIEQLYPEDFRYLNSNLLINSKKSMELEKQIIKILRDRGLNYSFITNIAANRNTEKNSKIIISIFVIGFIVLMAAICVANIYNTISTGISLCLAFISGIFIPQMYLGSSVLKVASFTPTYWYVKANNVLINVTSFRAGEIPQVFGYMAIETGFTIAIISIALVVSKRKRQQAF